MTKKHEDDKPEKHLGEGASGDPYNPHAGAPGVEKIVDREPAVTETHTHRPAPKTEEDDK